MKDPPCSSRPAASTSANLEKTESVTASQSACSRISLRAAANGLRVPVACPINTAASHAVMNLEVTKAGPLNHGILSWLPTSVPRMSSG